MEYFKGFMLLISRISTKIEGRYSKFDVINVRVLCLAVNILSQTDPGYGESGPIDRSLAVGSVVLFS